MNLLYRYWALTDRSGVNPSPDQDSAESVGCCDSKLMLLRYRDGRFVFPSKQPRGLGWHTVDTPPSWWFTTLKPEPDTSDEHV